MIVIGIDPGKDGGVAAIDTSVEMRDGTQVNKMPEDAAGLWHLLAQFSGGTAVLESVRSSPQMGVTSAFTFGRGFGRLEVALVAASISTHETRPQAWQRALMIPPTPSLGKDRKARAQAQAIHKKKLIAKAGQLFPWMKVYGWNADALLLAYYASHFVIPERQ
jgi:hypothetical protein